jgi:ankyrin repeat protein
MSEISSSQEAAVGPVSELGRRIFKAIDDDSLQALKDALTNLSSGLCEPCTRGGHNALQVASHLGRQQIVQWLIERGADVNAGAGSNIGTALQQAAANGHRGVVQLLLQKGASVHEEDAHGSTPLHAACACYKHPEVVQWLLDAGADPHHTNALRQSPVLLAVQAASWGSSSRDSITRILELLLEQGVDLVEEDAYGNSPLSLAFSSCADATSSQPIPICHRTVGSNGSDRCDHNSYDEMATATSRRGDNQFSLGVLQQLLARHLAAPAAPSSNWELCMRAGRMGLKAAFQQILGMGGVESLIDQGDSDGIRLLHYAAGQGWGDMVQQLLWMGATADVVLSRVRTTPLHYAVTHGSEGAVQALLAGNANPFHLDWEGLTPFHRAAKEGRAGLVQLMLAEAQQRGVGELVNWVFRSKWEAGTALHLAALSGCPDVVQVLLDGGADRAAKDSRGDTPFEALCRMWLYASSQFETGPGAAQVIAVLAEQDDLSALKDGQTQLQRAIARQKPQLAAALVAAGAHCSLVVGGQGHTPLEAAAQQLVKFRHASPIQEQWLKLVLAMLRKELPAFAEQQRGAPQQPQQPPPAPQQQQILGGGQLPASRVYHLVVPMLYMMAPAPGGALSQCLGAAVEVLGAARVSVLWADLLSYHASLPGDKQAPGATLVQGLAQGCLLAYPPHVEQRAATLQRLQQLVTDPGRKGAQQAPSQKAPTRPGRKQRRRLNKLRRGMQAAAVAEYQRQAAPGGSLVECLRLVEKDLGVAGPATASAVMDGIVQAATAGQEDGAEVGPQAAALCEALLVAWPEGGRAAVLQRQLAIPVVGAVQLWGHAQQGRRGRGRR